MNSFQNKNQAKKNPGSYSIESNKLRIQNLNGQSSVLFEDISSITWKHQFIPNPTYLLIGFMLLFFGPMYILTLGTKNNSEDSNMNMLTLLSALVSVGLIIYGFLNKQQWDDVIIETRGGMLLYYSTAFNQGSHDVNKIEEAKRNLQSK